VSFRRTCLPVGKCNEEKSFENPGSAHSLPAGRQGFLVGTRNDNQGVSHYLLPKRLGISNINVDENDLEFLCGYASIGISLVGFLYFIIFYNEEISWLIIYLGWKDL